MTTFTRSGNGANPWCDFAPHQSGWMAVWSQPGLVEFEEASGNRIIRPVPTDFLRYLDADGNGTEVVAIGVGSDDHAYLVSTARQGWTDLGLVVGNFPVAVLWDGATFIPILVNSSTTYTINGNQRAIPIGATSQGIRQILNDTIIWGDETHVREVAGRHIHKYSHIGPIFCGQRNGPDHIDLFDGIWHTAIEGSAQPPKMTHFLDGSIGVCAATNHGAVFTIGPPWPDLIPDTPPPDPPDPPDPPVEPDMDFPPDAWAVVEDMHAAFSDMFPETEEGAREWTGMVNEQLAFSFPSGGWCWKKQAPANPPSKDVAARQIEGRFEGWDLLSAAGDNGPRVLATYPPQYHNLAGQVPIPVTPTNHLGTAPPPDTHPYEGGENDTGICDICGKPKADPIHTTAPPPDGDLEEAVANLEIDMAIVQEQLIKHDERITALETAAPPSGGVTVEQVNAIVQAALRKATVDVTVGRAYAHSHPATGKIVP